MIFQYNTERTKLILQCSLEEGIPSADDQQVLAALAATIGLIGGTIEFKFASQVEGIDGYKVEFNPKGEVCPSCLKNENECNCNA